MKYEYIPFIDLLSNIIDNRGRTCPTQEIGIPLIATNCITNDTLYPTYEKIRYVSEETYSSWFRGHPKPGDLIFVTKGSPGHVCMVPDPIDFCIAQDMVAIRADPTKIYPKYLFAILRTNEIQRQIENLHVGTLIPHFKKGDFDKLLIPVVDQVDQKIIGDMYFDLSAKIELNRRMNRTLEEIAQALFKEWFVDNPEAQGWEKGKLGDVANNIRQVALPQELAANTPYIGLEHMPRKSIALYNWGNASEVASNKFWFQENAVLFGKLRPYFHKVGPAPIKGVCSTDILVIQPKSADWYGLVLFHLSSEELVNYSNSASTGTKMPRTSWEYISNYPICIPPIEFSKYFTNTIQPIVEQIFNNIHQSRTLTQLRDSLLPRLMRGEVRVKDLA